MNAALTLTVSLSFAASMAGNQADLQSLTRGCALVQKAYPLLMLAVMAEGPMSCGTHTGDDVDCDANDTPAQAAKQAERLEIRKRQEAVFQRASQACDLYASHPKLTSAQQAAAAGLALAKEVGTDLPKELQDAE
jgi:hypothetical protein